MVPDLDEIFPLRPDYYDMGEEIRVRIRGVRRRRMPAPGVYWRVLGGTRAAISSASARLEDTVHKDLWEAWDGF